MGSHKKGEAPRDFHEPWTTTQSTAHGQCPNFADNDPAPEEMKAWLVEKWQRADTNAPWVIWGSRLSPPAACVTMLQDVVVADDRGIVTTVHSPIDIGDTDYVSREDIAKRIAACVNACRGIPNPPTWIADARELLLALTDMILDDNTEARVVSLLSRQATNREDLEVTRYDEELDF